MTLDEIKSCAIGVLDFIDKVCKDNNLKYYLSGGTLLGALRHKGFIPWDDDIDIMMPRHDYELLFNVWPKDAPYQVLSYRNSKHFPYAFGKAVDTRTIKIEPVRSLCQHLGVDVDIFPIDNIPNDSRESELLFREIEKWQLRLDRHMAMYGKARNIPRTIAYNTLLFLRRFFELFGINTVDKIVRKFSGCAQKYNEVSTSFCGVTTISHYGIKEKNPKESYKEVAFVQFEGKDYPAPNGYERYLTQLYGKDYMQLPPMNMRQSHHSYKAYLK